MRMLQWPLFLFHAAFAVQSAFICRQISLLAWNLQALLLFVIIVFVARIWAKVKTPSHFYVCFGLGLYANEQSRCVRMFYIQAIISVASNSSSRRSLCSDYLFNTADSNNICRWSGNRERASLCFLPDLKKTWNSPPALLRFVPLLILLNIIF